ncbi:MAG TPA: lipopolysaccharide biosynthesis protein [Pseudonocardiaceae bacterium]|nr:lipopolysaccharide biosynthesis protein [Pseudonocardiaceae bacterium]
MNPDPVNTEPPAAGQAATSNPDLGNLSATLRKGAVISAFVLVVVQVTSLLQTLVLARLLSPLEIGLFAAGTVLSNMLLTISDGGLRGALIQRETDVEDAAETVFWASLVTGTLMSLVMLAASPVIALVFDSRVAGLIAAVTAGTMLLHSMTNVPDALMQRRFNFKRRLIVDPSVAITFATVSVLLAVFGFGVWSLVAGSYASLVVWIATTWLLAGWKPRRARASVRMWRELARFALPLVIEGIGDRARETIETVVVGRGLSTTSLGHYRYGRRIAMIPGLAVVQVCSYVLFPAFSRIAGDPDRFRRAFLRALGLIWFAAVPVAGLIIALGEPLAVMLLGERWRAAGVVLVALAGYGLGEALNAVCGESLKGAGRPHLLNWLTAIGLVSLVGLLFALIPFGLVGVGLAISLSAVIVGVVNLALARRVVGVPVGDVLARMVPPVVGSLVALAIVAPLEHLVLHSDLQGTGLAGVISGLGLLAAESVLFGLIYLVVLRVIAPATVTELVSGIRRLFARRKRSEGESAPS